MPLSTTALYRLHEELSGRLMDFTGRKLPVQFAEIAAEYQHTRKSASLFDVSCMGQVLIYPKSGNLADAATTLETLIPTSVAGLKEGRQYYGLFTDKNGGILDDLIFANHGGRYFLMVNTARSNHDLGLPRTLEGVTVEHITDRSLLTLQGPRAEEALTGLTPDAAGLRFIDSWILDWDGVTVWVSRSGYTGEDGFEISASSAEVEHLARALLRIGWVLPAGPGTRDSLCFKAGMPLYGHEFNPQITPVRADLGWAIPKVWHLGGSREGGFPRTGVILKQLARGTSHKRVDLRTEGRAPMHEGTKLFLSGTATEPVAKAISGGFDLTVDGPAVMAMLPTGIRPGATVHAEVHGRRLPLTVTTLPFITLFYKRREESNMIKYTKDRDWLDSGDDGVAVGLTKYATSELGDVVCVELPEVGTGVTKREEIVVIESTEATSGIVAPFDGVVAEVNQTAVDSPKTVSESPAGPWFFEIRSEDPSALEEYLDEDEYKTLIG